MRKEIATVLLILGVLPANGQQVRVSGQPLEVPSAWVRTADGKSAHELLIPNPVSADPGYVQGMKPLEYFQILCNEAGEFKFLEVSGVQGIYYARVPKNPTDEDLMDRYSMEFPLIERSVHTIPKTPEWRAIRFVNPPWNDFEFYEEKDQKNPQEFIKLSGFAAGKMDEAGAVMRTPSKSMKKEHRSFLESEWAVTWRGIKRPFDRQLGISGGEVIVYRQSTKEVAYVYRDYAISGRTKGTPDGVWWLNAASCPQMNRDFDLAGTKNLSARIRSALKK